MLFCLEVRENRSSLGEEFAWGTSSNKYALHYKAKISLAPYRKPKFLRSELWDSGEKDGSVF